MPRRHWKLHGFITTVALLGLLVAGWSCGSGGGSGVGPTAPKDPLPLGDATFLSGTYHGMSNLTSVSGCGCVSEVAQAWLNSDNDPWRSHGGPINFYEWEIEQLNADLWGTIFLEWQKGLATSGWCEFEGAKPNFRELDSLFTADTLRCGQDPVQVECANGLSRDLVLESLHWEGHLEDPLQFGNEGDWTGTWRCLDPANGSEIGALELRGEWTTVLPIDD